MKLKDVKRLVKKWDLNGDFKLNFSKLEKSFNVKATKRFLLKLDRKIRRYGLALEKHIDYIKITNIIDLEENKEVTVADG